MFRALLVWLIPLSLWTEPRLTLLETEIDFGERRTGELVEVEYRIRNQGTSPLRIHKIRASCGCTTPKIKELRIPPGETAALPIGINLKGRVGPQQQRVNLYTNDPGSPLVTLRLTGHSVPRILVDPITLNLGMVDPEKPEPGTITLKSTQDLPFEITRITSKRDRLNTEIERSPDGLSSSIHVIPTHTSGQGQFTETLIVDTSDPDVQAQRILVIWQISRGVSVAPNTVSMRVTGNAQLLNRYLMVRDYPGIKHPLEIKEVRWPGFEEVTIVPQNLPRFGWRIHLSNFTPSVEMDGSEIVITTNAEGFETLRIPVKVLQ